MNKKLIALLLAVIMVLSVGCGKDKGGEETTDPSEAVEETTAPNEIPGVQHLDEPIENPFDQQEDSEEAPIDEPAEDNTGNSGNTGNTGNGVNSGNTGNAGNSGNTGNTGNAGNGGNSGNTGNSGNSGNTGNTGSNAGGGNSGGSNTEKPTQPSGGNNEGTKPTEPAVMEPSSGSERVSYEEYNAMTPAEQVAYYNQFDSMEAFVQWYNEAKDAYDREHGAIDVGDGNIDLGDLEKP